MTKLRKIPFITKLLKNRHYTTKVYIYFSTKTAGDDYDPYEKNYTYTNLNPRVIKAYVRDVSPEALVYKQYGLSEMGAKEILCESKYKNWFEKANKIEIDGDKYTPFLKAAGNRAIIVGRPFGMIKIVLAKSE